MSRVADLLFRWDRTSEKFDISVQMCYNAFMTCYDPVFYELVWHCARRIAWEENFNGAYKKAV